MMRLSLMPGFTRSSLPDCNWSAAKPRTSRFHLPLTATTSLETVVVVVVAVVAVVGQAGVGCWGSGCF